jgi:hypothetical protein
MSSFSALRSASFILNGYTHSLKEQWLVIQPFALVEFADASLPHFLSKRFQAFLSILSQHLPVLFAFLHLVTSKRFHEAAQITQVLRGTTTIHMECPRLHEASGVYEGLFWLRYGQGNNAK